MKPFLVVIFSLLITLTVSGQPEESENHLKHRIAPLLGYVFVPSETSSDVSGTVRLIPTFGIDYEYKFHPKFAIGWFSDIELSGYVINYEDSEEDLVREYAFITTLNLVYSPIHRFTVYGGAGYEFEKHHNFFVVRLGTEYEIPIHNNWDIAFGLSFDHKQVYNSFAFTVAFGKKF